MANPASDRNLLFGILAVQLDFITRDQLLAGMHAWVLEKSTPLGEVLRKQGALDAPAHGLLEALVQRHLAQHDDDPEKSLASIGSDTTVRRQLDQIPDADLHESLLTIRGVDPGQLKAESTDSLTRDNRPSASGLRFRVLRPHAKGGLGQVSVALDLELQREVALKEIQLRHADSPEARARFLLEGEITGKLEHPGIVPVYGLGQYADGRPFYAMRFIKGDSLKKAIARYHDSARGPRSAGEQALELRKLLGRFIDVCDAMAYAHSRGVLHRDLKPGNIMLGQYGETLVVDWGLAKAQGQVDLPTTLTEPPILLSSGSDSAPTEVGQVVGTPAYMSPEQAAGRLDELGPASDVYSLGATLYCLLTGRAPYEKSAEGKTLDRVQKGDFPRPRELKPNLSPALEAICLKAMALRPSDRYPTVRALAEDVERWLADDPVSAWPEPWTAKSRRWAGRHRSMVTGAVAAVSVAALSLAIALAALHDAFEAEKTARGLAQHNEAEATRERNQAFEARGQADKQKAIAEQQAKDLLTADAKIRASLARLAATTGLAADDAWDAGKVARAMQLLLDIPREFRGWEWDLRKRRFQGSYATLFGHLGGLNGVAFIPDGLLMASAGADGTVKVWDARTGQELATLTGHDGAVVAVAFSPDGRQLASAGSDQTVKLWDPRALRALATLTGHAGSVSSVAFSPDGKLLASGGSGDDTVMVWDARTGRALASLRGHVNSITQVAFSPDSRRLASSSFDETIKVWDPRSGEDLMTLRGHASGVACLAISPDGQRLASGSWQEVKLWDMRTGQEWTTLPGHAETVTSASFSPDGLSLATASADRTVKLWDIGTSKELATLRGHAGGVNGVAFTPDGQRLASSSADRTIKLWLTRPNEDPTRLRGHGSWVNSVAYRPDSQHLASGGGDGTVKIWDARSGHPLLAIEAHASEISGVAYSPDGQHLASAGLDKTIKIWDARTAKELATLRGHTQFVHGVTYHPTGQRLASASADHTIKVWDLRTGQADLTLHGHSAGVWRVAFSMDGAFLASASLDQTAKVWNANTGEVVLTLKGHSGPVTSITFSPDGLLVATGSRDMTVKIWDRRSGQEILSLPGHGVSVEALAFTPDGQRLASGGNDAHVILWDARTGQELASLHGDAFAVTSLAFSPDGRQLAAGGTDASVKLWNARPGPVRAVLRGHGKEITGVMFSPGGDMLLSTDTSGRQLVWDPRTGERLPITADAVIPPSSAARHPSLPLLALVFKDQIHLVDVGPPDSFELVHRGEALARFDGSWHLQQANRHEKAARWYAAAFHWAQLAKHEPQQQTHWDKLNAACLAAGTWQPARLACDRLLQDNPALGPIYFQRAAQRANFLQFHEAIADHLSGLALSATHPIGWPSFAQVAAERGNQHAASGKWPQALQAFAEAVTWERQEAGHLQSLALAQLAAKQPNGFKAACRDLFTGYQSAKDVQATYELSAQLADAPSGPGVFGSLGQIKTAALLHSIQQSRIEAIVRTACVEADHGLPAADLVKLARQHVETSRTTQALETLGAAQYRAGQFAEAAATLDEAAKSPNTKKSNWLILFQAMTRHRLGQEQQAAAWFNQTWLPLAADWKQRLIFERLQQEVNQIVKADR